jgi:hypothetical protein
MNLSSDLVLIVISNIQNCMFTSHNRINHFICIQIVDFLKIWSFDFYFVESTKIF